VTPTLPPVCILAGGRGTRLGDRVRNIPKPLVEVAGAPFLVHQLRLLASHGVTDIVLCVGYLAEMILERIGTTCCGIRITYQFDAPGPGGTLSAIRDALDALGERFLVLYGDAYLRIDYGAAAAAWRRAGTPAMMAVLRNENRWDASNALVDGARVIAYDKRSPQPRMTWIDYGLGGLESRVVTRAARASTDLGDLYAELARRGQLFAFEATERFYEIGTPESLEETDRFLRGLQQAGDEHGEAPAVRGECP